MCFHFIDYGAIISLVMKAVSVLRIVRGHRSEHLAHAALTDHIAACHPCFVYQSLCKHVGTASSESHCPKCTTMLILRKE